MTSVYERSMQHPGHGGIVVVAPIGTKPLLGGSFRTVPAGTLSGLRILLSSTSAGADKLNFSAIEYSESPDCTVYSRTAVNAVVVDCATVVVVADDDDSPDPPPANNPERTASAAKTHVLHSRYMWSRVRKNINSMLGARTIRSVRSTCFVPHETFDGALS